MLQFNFVLKKNSSLRAFVTLKAGAAWGALSDGRLAPEVGQMCFFFYTDIFIHEMKFIYILYSVIHQIKFEIWAFSTNHTIWKIGFVFQNATNTLRAF